MIQQSDKDVITLDSEPAIIGRRYRVRLLKTVRGKAVIEVTDLRPEPLVVPDLDERHKKGTI